MVGLLGLAIYVRGVSEVVFVSDSDSAEQRTI